MMKHFEIWTRGGSGQIVGRPATVLPLLLLCVALPQASRAQQRSPSVNPGIRQSVDFTVPGNATSSEAIGPASSSTDGDATLPDAPAPQTSSHDNSASGAAASERVEPKRAKVILPGWRAQRLSTHDQMIMGLTDLYSVANFGAMFLSSGYEQLTNGQPNYGTDRGAFGERLGAAAIRETSQGVFTDMVFGPLLREDTRYYELGPQKNVVHRTLYAITRPLVTRKDNGGSTVNGALLLGYAASAALTPAFYPSINRNFHDTAATFAGSIGGAALGFFVTEFTGDVLSAVHLKRPH